MTGRACGAKLLAAAAALEYEIGRVPRDVRILDMLEGVVEIRAHVVGRGLPARGSGH